MKNTILLIALLFLNVISWGQNSKNSIEPDPYDIDDRKPELSIKHLRYDKDSTVTQWKLGILPIKNGKVAYEYIFPVNDITKRELYNRAKFWFAKSFRDAKEVLQVDDSEGGKIIAKGISHVYWKATFAHIYDVSLWQLIDVSVKDNKVKILITDITANCYTSPTGYFSGSSNGIPMEDWSTKKDGTLMRKDNTAKFFIDVDQTIRETLESFKEFMNKPSLSTGDDW